MLNNLTVDPGPALLAESVEQMKLMGSPNQRKRSAPTWRSARRGLRMWIMFSVIPGAERAP